MHLHKVVVTASGKPTFQALGLKRQMEEARQRRLEQMTAEINEGQASSSTSSSSSSFEPNQTNIRLKNKEVKDDPTNNTANRRGYNDNDDDDERDDEDERQRLLRLTDQQIKERNDRLRFEELLQRSGTVLNEYSADGYMSKKQEEEESDARSTWPLE